jgi:hypothetical protein
LQAWQLAGTIEERVPYTSGAGYHYHHNAETYMEVGNALGRTMAELLNEKND